MKLTFETWVALNSTMLILWISSCVMCFIADPFLWVPIMTCIVIAMQITVRYKIKY